MKRINNIIDEGRNVAVNYAFEKFTESYYARSYVNTIPMLLSSIFLRLVFNFLITDRLITKNVYANFVIGVIVSTGCTLASPIFYSAVEVQAPKFMRITNVAMNNLMSTGGYDYYLMWKNRISLIIALLFIVVLLMVEVTSAYLIEMIVITIISGIIVAQVDHICTPTKYMSINPPTDVVIIRDERKITPPTIIQDYVVVQPSIPKIKPNNAGKVKIEIYQPQLKPKNQKIYASKEIVIVEDYCI